MKKSEIYRLAQGCVVTNDNLCVADKLAILRELMRQEDIELFCEGEEEKKRKEWQMPYERVPKWCFLLHQGNSRDRIS